MQNTLYTGDNLYILNGMNSETVDLIYLDPPFNSKRTYSAPIGSQAAGASFKDMWTWQDVDAECLNGLEDYPELVEYIWSIGRIHSKAMMSYVMYMTQRLIQLHRILKSTGSLYLHCDPTASHYLKIVLDQIFDSNNYRNEIVWQRQKGGKGSQFGSKKFGVNTDTIFFYTKSDTYYFSPYKILDRKEMKTKFNKVDENNRIYYDDSAHIFRNPSMHERPNLCYEWRGFKNPHPAGWRLSKERIEEEYQKGNIVIKADGKLERRKYPEDYKGVPIDNNWIDILRAHGKERTGYPTQKPLALLERIIKASSQIGDVVFDPFCGCATTCVAAQQLQRGWIGIDIEKQAVDLLVTRLSGKSDTGDKDIFKDFIHTDKIPQRTDIKIEEPSQSIKERLFAEQLGACNGCGTIFEIRHFEIDHIIPKSKGGGDYYENFQLLCSNCNRVKGNRPMEELVAKIRARDEVIKKVSY